MRASTSASHACGSTSFIFAVTMRLYMVAARAPPRSEPANSQARLPSAIPRSALSAALLLEANPPVGEEAREGVPALEHVVHRFGEVVVARQLGALPAHPGMKISDQRRAQLAARRLASIGVEAVDRPLDLEQGVDTPDRLQRDRRQDERRLALRLPPRRRLDVGEDEELAPGMSPTRRLR